MNGARPIRRRPRQPRAARWRTMSNACCASTIWAFRCSTTATTSARWRAIRACARLRYPGLRARPTSVRSSAAASARSAGRRCPAIPADIAKTDAKVKELIPDDPHLHHWLDMARSRIQFQGLPARICWVGLGQRHRLGLAFNEMVASGELAAPIVIGRDHSGFRIGRQPESRNRGHARRLRRRVRLAVAQRAAQHRQRRHLGLDPSRRRRRHGLLAACRCGHRLRRHQAAARRIARVLWNDPATGVMRHADAGYDSAIDCARANGLDCRWCVHGEPVTLAIELRAGQLSLSTLRQIYAQPTALSISAYDRVRIEAAVALVDTIVERGQAAYGINTGFRTARADAHSAPTARAVTAQSAAVPCRRRR